MAQKISVKRFSRISKWAVLMSVNIINPFPGCLLPVLQFPNPVITSFELALRDIALLDDLPWSLVIIDEVHRVKNANSGTTKAFHRFHSPLRFGLTGTAIQNNYTELWTILDWTNPKRLGTRSQWKGYVVEPLTVGQSVKATEEQRIKAIVSILSLDADLRLYPCYLESGQCVEGRGASQFLQAQVRLISTVVAIDF